MKKFILAAAAVAAFGVTLAAASAPAMAATIVREGPHRVIVEHRPIMRHHHLRRVVFFRHGHRVVVFR